MAQSEFESAQKEAQTGIKSLLTVARLMIGSEEFRTLLWHLLKVFQDLTNKALSKDNEKNEWVNVSKESVSSGEKKSADDASKEEPEKRKLEKTMEKYEDKYQLSEDTQMRLLDSFYDLLEKLKKNSEFKNSMIFLMNSAQSFKDNLQSQKKTAGNSVQAEQIKKETDLAIANARELIDRWLKPDLSISVIESHLREFISSFSDDSIVGKQFEKFKNDLIHFMNEEKEISREDFSKEFKESMATLRKTLLGKEMRIKTRHLSRTMERFSECLRRDESIQELNEEFARLATHLWKDEKGNFVIKPELASDLGVIFPVIFDKLKYVPLDQMSINDEVSDLMLNDMIVNCGNIAPGYWKVDLSVEHERGATGTRLSLMASQIYADVYNAKFDYFRKTFPKFEDHGLLDIGIRGDHGMSLILDVEPELMAKEVGDIPMKPISVQSFKAAPVFKITAATCNIDKISLHLHETSHDTLYSIIKPLMKPFVKGKIEKAIEQRLIGFIIDMNKYSLGVEEQKSFSTTNIEMVESSSTPLVKSEIALERGVKNQSPAWRSEMFD